MGFIFKSKWKSLDIVDAGPDINVEVDGMKCKKIIGKSHSEVGWVDLLKGGMRGPKHTQCPLLSPFSSLPL